ncbi:MAG: chromate transporter [Syntrophomonadaceae bacterium]|jgi:chromate transporter|nr:chromate transporter [Syntrophomonadaceae bacterium]
MLYLTLYLQFLKIGLLGFGGGYMMIPLFFMDIVDRYNWLSYEEMFNIIAVAQTVPGTFATNTATLVGLKMGSIGYGLVAVLGVVTPALLIAYLADRYVRPYLGSPSLQGVLKGITAAVIGIILATGLRMMHSAVIDGPTMITGLLAFVLFYSRRWNVAAATISAALAGAVLIYFVC